MVEITCQKQFNQQGNYTTEDIEIFNDCIQEGIEGLKADWTNEEEITITETDQELKFKFDGTRIKRSIMATIDNYGIPFIITE